jgi:aerobic C4-dicarboxylate transport protein
MAGLTLLLGVDRFMSEMRALTNLVGNGVATIVVARWERELNQDRMKRVLDGEGEVDDDKLLAAVSAIEPVPFVDQPGVTL